MFVNSRHCSPQIEIEFDVLIHGGGGRQDSTSCVLVEKSRYSHSQSSVPLSRVIERLFPGRKTAWPHDLCIAVLEVQRP